MYTLKKGSRILLQSPDFKSCAEKLNKLAGFYVVNKDEYYLNNVCFICYKDYILTGGQNAQK